MMGKVLIISKGETFMVVTMKKALKSAGYEVESCAMTPRLVNSSKAGVDMFVLYVDEGNEPDPEVLVILRELSVSSGKKVIVIASSEDLRIIKQTVPDSNLAATFVRPFDVHGFVNKLNELSRADKVEKKNVLIVDDDVTYLKMVNKWLADDYKVSVVSSGLQAIQWLAKNKADLIILDYEMPVANGSSIYEMLKSEPQTGEIPIMFLTGKNDMESIKTVLALKPERYLLKSIGKEALLDELDNFFSGRE
ncbi:MAG: response regulator [Lachnospiraceae bacterium]|nr:response regulator [Lachnospiraceae bacterium]